MAPLATSSPYGSSMQSQSSATASGPLGAKPKEVLTISRRTALALATSSPVVIASPLRALSRPKSELETLYNQLQDLFIKWCALDEKERQTSQLAKKQAAESCRFDPGERKPRTREESDAYIDALSQAEVDTGWDKASAELEACEIKVEALGKKIQLAEAHTIADLKAKALFVMFAARLAWLKTDVEIEYDELAVLSLVDAVCSVCGIEPIKPACRMIA